MEETGFVMDEPQREPVRERLEEIRFGPAEADDTQAPETENLESKSIEELEARLADLIADELYEEAARVSEIIKAKKGAK